MLTSLLSWYVLYEAPNKRKGRGVGGVNKHVQGWARIRFQSHPTRTLKRLTKGHR